MGHSTKKTGPGAGVPWPNLVAAAAKDAHSAVSSLHNLDLRTVPSSARPIVKSLRDQFGSLAQQAERVVAGAAGEVAARAMPSATKSAAAPAAKANGTARTAARKAGSAKAASAKKAPARPAAPAKKAAPASKASAPSRKTATTSAATGRRTAARKAPARKAASQTNG